MNRIIFSVLFILISKFAFSQMINVSGINNTGRFASCNLGTPTVTAQLINLNGGAVVNGGVWTCNNGCDSSTIRVTMTGIRWNQSPNAEWLHGLFLPANAGFVVSAVSIPPGFITYNPGCVGMCPSGSGFNGGPGFYFDNTANNSCCGPIVANDGFPCNNYGEVTMTCNNAFNLIFDIKFCNSIITNNSYTFVLHGSSDGETGCWNFNDLLPHNIQFDIATNPCNAPPINPTATAVTRTCTGGNLNYTSTLTGNCNNVYWWDDPIAGNLLGTGSPFTYDPPGAACPAGTTVYATCCTGNTAGCINRIPVTIPGVCDTLAIVFVDVTNGNCNLPGSINLVTVANAIGVVNYTLNPGGFANVTGIFPGLTQSTYTLTATDGSGCTASSIVNIVQPVPIVFANPIITGTTCALPNAGQVVVSATGGAGAIVYSISPFATQAQAGTFTGLSAQSYTITATDAANCTATTLVVINNSPAVNWVSVLATDASCNGNTDGSITATATGGVGTLTYSLLPGGANNITGVFTGLSPNTYTVIATDVNGCTVSSVVSIANPALLTWANVNAVNVLCPNGSNGSISVLATGGIPSYQYNLMPGNINNASGNFLFLPIGTYTVTATDMNGCTVTTAVNLTQPPALNFTATSSIAALCNGANSGSITVTASGGTGLLTYTLNPGNISNATGLFQNLTAGSYTITVSDANGCTTSTIINVSEPPAINFISVVTGSPSCDGVPNGSLSVVASGGTGTLTYTLNPPGITNGTGNFSGLLAGTYTVIATDINGCTISSVVNLAPPPVITFPVQNITPVLCNGQTNGAITIGAAGGAGGFNYLLQPGAVFNATGIFTGLAAGIYTITAIDANNCSNTITINVQEPAAMVWSVFNYTNITCNGLNDGNITATATGGLGVITYTLNPLGATNTTGIFTNLAANVYTLIASDANGCSINSVINIIDPGILTIANVAITPPNCVPGNNGIVDIVVNGGTQPLNYNLGAGNQLNSQFINVGQGTYTLTVTDANNCTATSVVNVVTPNSPAFTNLQVNNVTCYGGATGSILITATGGNGGITYTMQPGNVVNANGIFPNLTVGSYTITATDVNNCTTQSVVVVASPVVIVIDSLVIVDIICNNGNTGEIHVYASGGVGQLTYTLNPGNITNLTGSYTGLADGNYVVTITDANGCSIQQSVTIILLPYMVIDSLSFNTLNCAGGNNGYIYLSVTGGLAPVTYNLQPGNITSPVGYFTNLSAGSYQIIVTDGNGCTLPVGINLAQPSPLVITGLVNTLISCIPGSDGTITVNVAGGTPPYNYQLGAAGQPGNVFTGLNAGIYVITVTDIYGCTTVVWDTLYNPVPPVMTLANTTPISCNGGNNGTINVQATGGLGLLTYTLMPNNISNTTGIFNNLNGGTYTVTATDILNCTTLAVVTVVDPPPITFPNMVLTQPLCNGNLNGAISAIASGGTGLLTYTLTPGGITNTTGIFNNLGTGTYTISVVDINNCTGSTVVLLPQPSPLTWNTVNATNLLCNGLTNGSITVTTNGGTGTITYSILPTATVNITGIFNFLNANTYTITATDVNGCSITTAVTLTQPNVMTVTNLTTVPPSCIPGNDGSVTITVAGGTGPYNYNIGAGNQLSNTFTGLGSGNYTIVITDANNCTLTNIVSLANPGAPVVTGITPVDASCNGSNDGGLTIVTSGGAGIITYTLQPGALSNTTGIFTGLSAGTYTISVVDANGCTTVATATISAPVSIVFNSIVNTQVSCFGGNDGTITATAVGGVGVINYNLMPGNVTNTTGLFTNLIAGIYTITATDVNGCSTSSTTTVLEPLPLSWGNIVVGNVSCNAGNDGTISVIANGGTGVITYTLMPPNVSNTSGMFSNLAAGTYTIIASDANNCSISTTLIINQSTPVSITGIISTLPSCVPGNDATVTVTASGGLLPYLYDIGLGPQAANVFTGIGAGNYTITITDANGCTVTTAIIVTNPASPSITNVTLTNTLCFGSADGGISVTATGGNGVLTYTLLPNNINNLTGVFNNLPAGTYTVQVADAGNCTISTTMVVNQPNALAVSSIAVVDITCFGASDGSVTVTTVGGTGIVTYTLLPANISNQTGVFGNLNAGTFTINCTDANLCTTSTTFTVMEPTALIMGIPITGNVLCFAGNDGNVSITASGGTGNITYTLQPLGMTNNTGFFNSIAAGTYTITATDQNGCTTTSVVVITQPTQTQILNVAVVPPSCIPGNDGSITLTVTGGVPPYQFSINGGAPQPGNVFNNLAAGTYTILVADFNDCKVIQVVTIASPQAPAFTNVNITPVSCPGTSDGVINVLAQGGVGTINYTLLPNNITNATGIFNNLAAATYTVNAVDANNCSVSTIVVVGSPPALVWFTFLNVNITCFNGNDGSVVSSVSGGIAPINYNLQPGNQNNNPGNFNNLIAGTYTITATDANGCSISTIFNITQPSQLTWTNTLLTQVSCNGANDGEISVTATGGTGTISYNLQPLNITNATGIFTTLTAGSYTVFATDANNCSISTVVMITEPPVLQITNVTQITPSCVPGNDGTIVVTGSGGTAPYSFSIGGPFQPGSTFTNVGIGTYTITIVDANNCSVSSIYNVTAPNAPVITASNAVAVSCNGGNDGSITVTATGGVGVINYTLLPNNITNTTGIFGSLTAGTYTVTAIDANNCSASVVLIVTEPAGMSWQSVLLTNVTCNGAADGSITVSVSGGTAPYNYTLQPVNITNLTGVFTNLQPVNYTLTATDANGCSISTVINITEPTQLVWTNTQVFGVNCFGGSDGAINVAATGGTGNIDYNLQPLNITNATGIFGNLSVGTYTIYATDANNCSISTLVNITQPPVLQITNVTQIAPSCVPGNDGTLMVTGNGGNIPYSFSIGGPFQPGSTFLNVGIGTYTVTIMDANNCSVSSVYVMTAPNAPVINNSGSTPVLCNGGNDGTITVTASGGVGTINYTLLPNNITNVSGNFTGLTAGTYTINAVDANNCSASAVVIVTEPSPLTWASVAGANVTCNGGADGSITAVAAGGIAPYSYTLQPVNITNLTGVFTGLLPNTYTLIASDANGCTLTTTVTITEPTLITWMNTLSTQVSCNGGNDGSITVSATGGTGLINYTVQPINVTNATGIFATLTAGSYTVYAMDANNCSISTVMVITEPPILQITNVSNTTPSCVPGNDGSITITAAGGTPLYTYSIGGPGQAGNVFNNIGIGNYTIVVTDANNCTVSSVYIVTAPNAPTITGITTTDASCVPGGDGTATVTAIGGNGAYTYSSDGINFQVSNILTGLSNTTYTIVVADAFGCTVSSTVLINNAPSPSISNVLITPASCSPGCDGSVTFTATGGNPVNYTYSLDGIVFQASPTFSNLCAGNYTVTVTDGNGCTGTSALVISTANGPLITGTTGVNILCFGNNTGSITVVTTGGAAPVNYTLQPNNITNLTGIFNNLLAGSYTVVVTDANGCGGATTIILTEPPLLQFNNVVATGSLCNGAQNGTIVAPTTGGTGAIVYSISPAANFVPPNTFNNLTGNITYTIIATDANGCSISTTVFVAQPPVLQIDSSFYTNISCSNANDGTISVYASGGTGVLNYNLMPGAINNITGLFTALTANTYTVTITDANNCSLSASFTITNPLPITLVSISSTNENCNNAMDGSITIVCTGGTGILNYNLQPTNVNNTTGIFLGLGGNNYTITVTDANNCSYTTTMAVVNPPIISFSSFITTDISCFGSNNGIINATAAGGTGTYIYVLQPLGINNGTGLFNGLTPGTYTVVVSDANLCSTSSVTTVNEPLPLNLVLISSQNVACHGGNDGAIVVSASGGVLPYTFTLNPTGVVNTTGDFQNVMAGTYNVVVADANGCTSIVSNIVIIEPPSIVFTTVSHVDVICHGDSTGSITVQATGGTGSIVFSLSPAIGLQSPPGFFQYLPALIYTVTATDASNCTLTTLVNVQQNPDIIISEITYVEPICYMDANGEIHFQGSGGVPPLQYHMDNGAGQPTGSFVGLIGGYHLLTITDAMGCRQDSLFLLPQPLPVHAGSLSIVPETCINSKDAKIFVKGAGGRGFFTYYLRPGLHINQTGIFMGLKAGIYTITIVDSARCTFDTVITITPPVNPLSLNITKQNLGCYGTGIEGWAQANATGGEQPYTYLWSTTPTQVTDRATDLYFGYYFLEVTDANGCIEKDTVYIEPGPCCEEIFIPNAFSPNGDGNNDVFRVTTATGVELIQFDVYDRWGQRVWGTNEFRNGWDGKVAGKDADLNTYFYVFRYKCLTDGQNYIKKGDIILVR